MKKYTIVYKYNSAEKGIITFIDVVKAFTKFGARLKSHGRDFNGAKLESVTVLKGSLNEK